MRVEQDGRVPARAQILKSTQYNNFYIIMLGQWLLRFFSPQSKKTSTQYYNLYIIIMLGQRLLRFFPSVARTYWRHFFKKKSKKLKKNSPQSHGLTGDNSIFHFWMLSLRFFFLLSLRRTDSLGTLLLGKRACLSLCAMTLLVQVCKGKKKTGKK